MRVIWLLLGAAFVVMLNETVMGVATPNIVADLGITIDAAQWLTTGFMLTMAVVIPITGFLINRFTTRQVFIAAMSLFSLGTLAAASAPGFELLLGARIVQATGTAMMMPLLMTTIMSQVPAASRGRFMGRISIVMSVAPALGPTASGLVLSVLSWRYLFWIVLPIAVIMLLIGARKITNIGENTRTPIDALSIALSAIGFGGLLFGLSSIGSVVNGAGSAIQMSVSIAAGVLGVAAFILRQLALQRADRALLDLRIFKTRAFSTSVGMMALAMSAMFGTLILLPLYLQNVLGLTPVATGLMMLPGGLVTGLLAPFVGRLFDSYGPRPLVIPGSFVVSAALWGLTTVTAHTQPWIVIAAHVTLSIGLGLMFTPLFTSALGSLPAKLYSYGSAALSTVQQIAGAAGTALFVTVLSAHTAALASSGAGAIDAQAGGIRLAFIVGAALSLLVIVGAFFVRAPVAAETPVEPAVDTGQIPDPRLESQTH